MKSHGEAQGKASGRASLGEGPPVGKAELKSTALTFFDLGSVTVSLPTLPKPCFLCHAATGWAEGGVGYWFFTGLCFQNPRTLAFSLMACTGEWLRTWPASRSCTTWSNLEQRTFFSMSSLESSLKHTSVFTIKNFTVN